MSTTSYSTALAYFCRPVMPFWRWDEQGQVIEWTDNDHTTICYRAELEQLLSGLQEQGLPPLNTLLLLLAACSNNWPRAQATIARFAAWGQGRPQPDDPTAKQVTCVRQQALGFLEVVTRLPASLRTGPPKLHLLREIFSAQAPQVPPTLAPAVLDEWTSGRLDAQGVWPGVSLREHLHELSALADALTRFPTTDELARHLRTGLSAPPAPLPELLALPATPEVPAAAPGTLLDQLAGDPRTAGLAQLARHLLAGLRIPAHTQGAGEMPLGGRADLSNRGSLDRLLLGELAHDDLTLTARLANNEALYWRREEPPQPTPPPQVLLLDTTLRLWGTPRVFGLAAALAWQQLAATARRPAPAALALGGQHATPLDLASVAGVVEALTYLDPAPHAGPALAALGARSAPSPADYVLITATELMQPGTAFGQALAASGLPLRWLLAVDRDGTLALYEWAGGHRQLRSTSHHDVAALLATTARPPAPPAPADGPAFWQQPVAPLYLPLIGGQIHTANALLTNTLGALAVTDTRRLLYVPSTQTGAQELLASVARGSYYFGTDEGSYLAVLIITKGVLHVHKLTVATSQLTTFDLSAELPAGAIFRAIQFTNNTFNLKLHNGFVSFDCQRELVLPPAESKLAATPPPPADSSQPLKVQDFLRVHYDVLRRTKRIGVSGEGELLLDGFVLRLGSLLLAHGQQLYLLRDTLPTMPHPATGARSQSASTNRQLTLRTFRWPEGSSCLLDSRGLLHLRSADAALPEVTIVLVLNLPAAAWAADGAVCGPDYFTGPHPAQRRPADEFYRAYIQPFLQRIALGPIAPA